MAIDDKHRALQRLHALMAHTVANGCTTEEEVSAARMAGRLAEEIAGGESFDSKSSAAPSGLGPSGPAERLRAERESADYKAALEKSIMEGLLKTAIQELSLGHINTLSPPGRRVDNNVQWLDVRHLLNSHLAMVLGVASARMARQILADTIEELVQDGMLPERLAIPNER